MIETNLRFTFVMCVTFLLSFNSANTLSLLAETSPIVAQSRDQILESGLTVLFSEDLGYTLLGEKPVTIVECSDYYLCTNPVALDIVLQFLQKTFKRSSKYLVKTFRDNQYYRIEFINRQALKNIVKKNSELQCFVNKKFSCLDGLLEKFDSSDESIFDLFDGDAFLIGLILGYGRTNSEYFCRRCALGVYLKKYPLVCLLSFNPEPHKGYAIARRFNMEEIPDTIEKPLLSKNFESLEAEWQWIQKISWNLENECAPKPPGYISLPFYICCHGGDSEITRTRFLKARHRLAALFYNRSFKEVIIEAVQE